MCPLLILGDGGASRLCAVCHECNEFIESRSSEAEPDMDISDENMDVEPLDGAVGDAHVLVHEAPHRVVVGRPPVLDRLAVVEELDALQPHRLRP